MARIRTDIHIPGTTSDRLSGEKSGKKPQPALYTDHQAAALWLTNASGIFDVGKQPRPASIVKTYSTWTYVANGSELEAAEDPDRTPDHWKRGVLQARCLLSARIDRW